jgi:hypothetical protein
LFDSDTALFDFDQDFISLIQPNKIRQQRFFRYLPLFSGNEYIISLTVYVSRNGIVRLKAYFTRTSRLLDSRKGCKIHFPLYSNKQIVYAWLRIVDFRSAVFAAPALAVGLIVI